MNAFRTLLSVAFVALLGTSHSPATPPVSRAGHWEPGRWIYPDKGPAQCAVVEIEAQSGFSCAVIDATGEYALFATSGSPGSIVKVALRRGDTLPRAVGALTLEEGEDSLRCVLIDRARGHAYFGTATLPGRVVKVALGEADQPPVRIGAVVLEKGEDNLACAVIDPKRGYAWFGTDTAPGRVVKVALGHGNAEPSRVGALTLGDGEDHLSAAVVHPPTHTACFATGTSPGRVVKVGTGVGKLPPIRIAGMTLMPGEGRILSAAYDTVNEYIYLGTDGPMATVVNLAMERANKPPTRLGAAELGAMAVGIVTALGDGSSGYIDFLSENPDAGIQRFSVHQGKGGGIPSFTQDMLMPIPIAKGLTRGTPLKRSASIPLKNVRGPVGCAISDPGGKYTYVGTNSVPPQIAKVSNGQNGFLHGTRFEMPEAGVLQDVRLYTHELGFIVRLSLYADLPGGGLLWESGPVQVEGPEFEIVVPAQAGTPADGLTLQPGRYWLAWQVDRPVKGPSYTAAADGSRFSLPVSFDTLPAKLDTDKLALGEGKWTQYITYRPAGSPEKPQQ